MLILQHLVPLVMSLITAFETCLVQELQATDLLSQNGLEKSYKTAAVI